MTNIRIFNIFMHVGEYYHATQMYKKCLIVALLILISGNVISFTFQFYDNLFIFAQTNQAPEAKDQKVSMNANDKVKITLEGNDDDKDDKIQFDIVSDPSHGKLDNFDKSDGTVTYIPDADYSGNDGFKFRVIDDKGEQSDSADVEVEVKSINQAPEAKDQKVSVNANDKVKLTLEGNDDDKDDKIQFDIVSDPSHGKLDNFDKSDGTVTYIPDADYSGNDGFKFRVIDDKGEQSDSADVEVEVKSINQAPEAKDQKVSMNANDKVKITLEGNDDDKDDKIQFDIVSDPSHGKLDNFDKSDGTVTYIPEADYSGNDGFKFRVIDDKGEQSDSADVEVEVKDVTKTNQETMTTGDETNQETMTTGDETNQETMTTGDETNQETMTTGDETNQETMTTGDETTIKDQNQTTRQFMQNNELSANDQSPFAYDQDLSIHMNEKTEITMTGKDDDNDPIQFAIVSNPTDASLDNFDTTKGTLTFVPETDYVGNESFGFKVIDDKGMESNVATVSVKVSPRTDDVNMNNATNQAPTALSQNVATDKNNQINITMTGKDDDNDPIQFAIVSKPTDASLDNFDTTKGTLTFVPETDYVGNESFGFKVIDDKGMESNVATVSVDVKVNNQTNLAPLAFDESTNESNSEIHKYVVWSAGEEEDRYILFARSTDGGKSFSSPLSLSGSSH